jgi:hypothetical protein
VTEQFLPGILCPFGSFRSCVHRRGNPRRHLLAPFSNLWSSRNEGLPKIESSFVFTCRVSGGDVFATSGRHCNVQGTRPLLGKGLSRRRADTLRCR